MGIFDLKFRIIFLNGILVIVIDDDDVFFFQVFELINGCVVFFYNMGYGYRKLIFIKLYDNGVEVIIVKKDVDIRGFMFKLSIIFEDGKSEVFVNGKLFYKD